MADWVAIGALALGVGNAGYTIYAARQKPKDEDQRKHRKELRDILYPLKKECETALSTLRHGDEIPDDVPVAIRDAQAQLEPLGLVLVSPGKTHISLLRTLVGGVNQYWHDVTWTRRHVKDSAELQQQTEKLSEYGVPPLPVLFQARHVTAAETQLKESLEQIVKYATAYLDVTVEMDNGSRKAIRTYRG